MSRKRRENPDDWLEKQPRTNLKNKEEKTKPVTKIAACGHELDEFMAVKSKEKLNDFFDCMNREGYINND